MKAFKSFFSVALLLVSFFTSSSLPASSSCDPEKLRDITLELATILHHPWTYLFNYKRAQQLLLEIHRGLREIKTTNQRDVLTGVYSRAAYIRDMPQLVREHKRHGRSFAVLALDLDYFKRVNDSFGHQAGDVALRYFAHTLQSTLRAGDQVYRVGGDEFAIFMRDATIEGVKRYLKRVTEKLENSSLEKLPDGHWQIRNDGLGLVSLLFSVGATVIQPASIDPKIFEPYIKPERWNPPTDPDPFFGHADVNLYELKKKKKQGWAVITNWGDPPDTPGAQIKLFTPMQWRD